MKILILHQTIADHDAIGNDMYRMCEIFKEKHECFIYCNNLLSNKFAAVSKNGLNRIISAEDNLIIYHHSNYWEQGEDILKQARSRIVIRYHNITPAHFFERYNATYYHQCSLGRKQTQSLAHHLKEALWIGASAYNLQDITDIRPDHQEIIPPFNNIRRWSSIAPDESVLKSLIESKNINLLFVGRIAPNKGHKFLIEIVRDYLDTFGPNLCLNIVGKLDNGLRTYSFELEKLIANLNLRNKVNLVGEVNDNVLLSYYLGSDFFVCCSEHEGFCVPIVESQGLHLPVIARKAPAIKETMGLNQLILDNSVREYSAAIKVLTENVKYKAFIIDNGFRNYEERFSDKIVTTNLIRTIENYLGISI
jgi:glycosyltransferase involved in cell wall biosynthesis